MRARLKNKFTEDEKCHNLMRHNRMRRLNYIELSSASADLVHAIRKHKNRTFKMTISIV